MATTTQTHDRLTAGDFIFIPAWRRHRMRDVRRDIMRIGSEDSVSHPVAGRCPTSPKPRGAATASSRTNMRCCDGRWNRYRSQELNVGPCQDIV